MPADALVLFGAMGDLAHKKIFPALYHMVRHGHLDVPVIGIARAARTDEHLKERVRDSIQQQGGNIDREDAVEAAWAIVDPILGNATTLHQYEPGSWGPLEADRLGIDVGGWHDPE